MNNDQSYVKVIGLDPGSETLGVGILTMDIRTRAIVNLRGFTLKGSKLFDDEGWQANILGVRIARIQALGVRLHQIFVEEQPLNIACEAPFFSKFTPTAFGPLLEVVNAIRDAVIAYDSWTALHLIDPPTVKKAVGAKKPVDKTQRKQVVKDALIERYIQYFQYGLAEAELLDEHSVDAVAVAICRYQSLLNNLF